jgi:glutaredoxin
MLVFYRTPDCPRCGDIEDALEQLAMAHRVVEVHSQEELPHAVAEKHKLPVLLDGDKMISGSDRIIDHLEQQEAFRDMWYKFGSDACYCEE